MYFNYKEFTVREAQGSDKDLIWNWRNSESVRKWMSSIDIIPYQDHCKWFENRKVSGTHIHILHWNNDPVGVFTLKKNSENPNELIMTMYLIERYQMMGLGIVLDWFMLNQAFSIPECENVFGIMLPNNQVSRIHALFEFEITKYDDQYEKVFMTRLNFEEKKEALWAKVFRT